MATPTFPMQDEALTAQEHALFLELLSLSPAEQEALIAERVRSPGLAARLRSLLVQDAQSDAGLGDRLDGASPPPPPPRHRSRRTPGDAAQR